MKDFGKLVLGFNLISLRHLAQPGLFVRACHQAFTAARDWTGHPAHANLKKIPEIHLNEILGDRKANIRLSVMRYEDGLLPSVQAMTLLAILVAESPKEVLEIGTFMGHTTRLMAENLPDATIHTVDLPEEFSAETDPDRRLPKDDHHLIRERKVGREFRDLPCASHIKQHFGDTANWDFRNAGQPTAFFIDGGHSFEYCTNDSEKCLELCGGRGVFLWHDVDDVHPGVVDFVLDWRSKGRDVRRITGTAIAYWKAR